MLKLRHERTSTLDWTEQVTCPKCKANWKAGVKVEATGQGVARYGIGNESAQERAGIAAFSNASEFGEQLIRLAKCPRCGHRREGSYSLGVSGLGLGFVVGILISGAFAGVADALNLPAGGCLSILVLPGTMAWFSRWKRGREFAEADQAVVFERLP